MNAKKEATSIISQARQHSSESVTTGRTDAESDAQGLLSEARANAGSEADIVSNDGQIAQKSIHDSGKMNRVKAEKIVIDAFRN